MRILMSSPYIGEAEVKAVAEVLKSGWLGEGPKTRAFEAAVAEFTGASQVVAVNTGTSALHLAMIALGVGQGDEVILPSFTFVGDPMAVRLCGATPVFGDIDPLTLNLDPGRIENLITHRTKAILPTDYAGLPADVPGIKKALSGRDIRIIRDASHSFGTSIGDRKLGVWCGEDATCFSFDPIKHLTCGEGGAVLVNDAAVADRLRSLRSLGYEPGTQTTAAGHVIKGKCVTGYGYRYHMNDINAAIGLAQFNRFPDIVARKQALARHYDALLHELPAVKAFPRKYEEVVPFIYPVRIADGLRDGLVGHYAQHGIHADLRYSPCHWEPFFENGVPDLAETERVAAELICLPIYAGMNLQDVEEVVTLAVEYTA